VSGKNISDIYDCNLKKHYQILLIFDINIYNTTADQTTVQFSTALTVCFCTTWKNQTNEILHFYPILPVWVSRVVQKQTFGEVETRTVISWQVLSKLFAPKIIKSVNFSLSHSRCWEYFSRNSVYIKSYFFVGSVFPK